MKNILELLELFFECFKYALLDITLFPSTNLIPVFYIALSISSISLFAWVLDLPTFLDWRGAFLGTGILGIMTVFSLKEVK